MGTVMSTDPTGFSESQLPPRSSFPQDVAALVGRLLLGTIFVWSGYGKLMAASTTTAYFAKLGLPLPDAAYYLTVFVELCVGLMFILGFFTRWTALVLAAWCIATAMAAHTNFADRNMLIHFMKNLSMTGGFLYAAALGGGAYAVDRVMAPATRARSLSAQG
jgi:putative oxidoreductase